MTRLGTADSTPEASVLFVGMFATSRLSGDDGVSMEQDVFEKIRIGDTSCEQKRILLGLFSRKRVSHQEV